jgi:hypothetical protein
MCRRGVAVTPRCHRGRLVEPVDRRWPGHPLVHTTGLLCGQLVALITGAALVRRHRWPVALAVAVLLGAALAVTAFVAGQLLGRVGESIDISYTPTDDPVFVRMLVRDLAAYPL